MTSSIFFSLVYYIAFAAIALSPLILRKRPWQSIDPFEPYVGLSIILFFYSASALIGFEVNGLTDDLEAVSPNSVSKFALACLIGQAGLACGEFIGWGSDREHRNRVRIEIAPSGKREAFLIGTALTLSILLLPFYWDRFNFFYVESYADTAFESRLLRMEDINAGIKDIFLRDIPATILLCAATLILFDRKRLLAPRVLAAGAIVSYILTSLLSGSRSVLASTVLLPLLYYHYTVRRFSWPAILALGVLTYVLINVISIARISSNPLEMIELVQEKISTEGYEFLEIGQSGELRTSVNLVRLIVGLDTGEDTLRLGQITWDNIASTVPRTFWPGRPPTGAEQFAEVFYPGSLSSGAGFGSFIFQDPYWDFGFAGVFLMSLLYAWILRFLHATFIENRPSPFWLLCYSLTYGNLAVFVVRNGIFATLKNCLIVLVPMLLIAVLVRTDEHSNELKPAMDD